MEKIGIIFSNKSGINDTEKSNILTTLNKFQVLVNIIENKESDIEAYLLLETKLKHKEIDRAIIIDDFGTLPFMVLGKFSGTVVAQISDTHSAHMTSEHNGSNIICLGTKLNSIETIKKIIFNYVVTPFAAGRHLVRTDMLGEMLKKEEL